MNDGGNQGRTFYMRKYESTQDAEHNASGRPGRARSGSMGQLDAEGNRTNRFHFHALTGQTTLITSRNDAPPHTNRQQRQTSISSRPMLIPGALKYGTKEGVK